MSRPGAEPSFGTFKSLDTTTSLDLNFVVSDCLTKFGRRSLHNKGHQESREFVSLARCQDSRQRAHERDQHTFSCSDHPHRTAPHRNMADFGLEGAYGSLLPADYYKSVGLKKRANGDMVTWDVDPDPMANLLRGMARGVRGQVDAVEKGIDMIDKGLTDAGGGIGKEVEKLGKEVEKLGKGFDKGLAVAGDSIGKEVERFGKGFMSVVASLAPPRSPEAGLIKEMLEQGTAGAAASVGKPAMEADAVAVAAMAEPESTRVVAAGGRSKLSRSGSGTRMPGRMPSGASPPGRIPDGVVAHDFLVLGHIEKEEEEEEDLDVALAVVDLEKVERDLGLEAARDRDLGLRVSSRVGARDDAWTLKHSGGSVLVRAPVLHGTTRGKAWALRLSLATAKQEERLVELPGELAGGSSTGGTSSTSTRSTSQEAAALALSGTVGLGASEGGCPPLEWVLLIVPYARGALLQLQLTPLGVGGGGGAAAEAAAAESGAVLEHLSLASVDLDDCIAAAAAAAGASPATKPATTSVRTALALATLSTATAALTGAIAPAALARLVAFAELSPTVSSVAALCARAPTALAALSAAMGGLWWRSRSCESLTTVLINGWQTFSFSGALAGLEAQPRTPLPYFSAAFHTGATPPPPPQQGGGNELVSDLYSVVMPRHGKGTGVLLGFVTARRGAGGVRAVHSLPPRAELFSEHRAVLGAVLVTSRSGGAGAGTKASATITSDWAMILPFKGSEAHPSHLIGLRQCAVYLDTLSALSGVSAARSGASAAGRLSRLGSRPTSLLPPYVAPRRPPSGWCSWYCHGPNVSASLMLDTVAQLRAAKASGSLPLDLVQLDDGWQSCWGDWDLPHSKRFPNGLTPIAAAIKAAGMSPGLWMAPAALTADSRLFAEHPEWVLMDSNAKPLRCGYTAPGIWLHALDVSHPGALAHVRRVVGIATREWGFEYLKLDFLHAAAMPGGVRHDPSTSRAELLGRLMAAIRAEVGEHVFILGCGAPLGPCIGHVDAMRVSADAAPHWYPRVSDLPLVRSLFTSDRTNMPAARNMVRNVAVRMQLGGRLWRNDPDCLILRDAGADFTTGQAQALSTMAVLSAGALIFSDRPEDLTGARLAILQALLPPLPRAAVAADLLLHEVPTQLVLPLTQADLPLPGCTTLGEWWLVAFFNWSNQQAVPGSGGAALGFLLEAAESTDAPLRVSVRKPAIPAAAAATWHVFNFWEGSYSRLSDNDATAMLQPPPVPPRCCSLLAIRRVMPDGAGAQYIGSNVHCSCGLEVRLWHQTSSTAASSSSVLEFALGTGRAVTAPLVWLYLPGTISDGQRRPTVSAMDALSNEGATPSIEWAADQVWVVRLASIGVSGDSGVHHIVY